MNNRMGMILIAILAVPVGCENFGRGPCGDRTVTVNHNANEIEAHPDHVRMCRGDTLAVRLAPPVDPGSARTEPDPAQNPEATWLAGSNTQTGQIDLIVDQEAEVGRTYKYSITINGNTLDPRVTVAK